MTRFEDASSDEEQAGPSNAVDGKQAARSEWLPNKLINRISFKDQTFREINRDNPTRVRDYLLRNGLYWSHENPLVEHIRRHYRLENTQEQRNQIRGNA